MLRIEARPQRLVYSDRRPTPTSHPHRASPSGSDHPSHRSATACTEQGCWLALNTPVQDPAALHCPQARSGTSAQACLLAQFTPATMSRLVACSVTPPARCAETRVMRWGWRRQARSLRAVRPSQTAPEAVAPLLRAPAAGARAVPMRVALSMVTVVSTQAALMEAATTQAPDSAAIERPPRPRKRRSTWWRRSE